MRYRGGTYEYWWSHLTLRRLYEIERDLEQHPPADWFVAGYFKYIPRERWPIGQNTSDAASDEAREAKAEALRLMYEGDIQPLVEPVAPPEPPKPAPADSVFDPTADALRRHFED